MELLFIIFQPVVDMLCENVGAYPQSPFLTVVDRLFTYRFAAFEHKLGVDISRIAILSNDIAEDGLCVSCHLSVGFNGLRYPIGLRYYTRSG